MKIMLGVFVLSFALAVADDASAQRRGGGGGRGGGGFSRGGARSSINARPSSRAGMHRGGGGFNRPSQLPSRGNIDRANRPSQLPSRGNIDAGRTNIGSGNRVNRDVNINRPVNIGDVDIDGRYGHWDGRWDGCCHYHPLARAAAGAAVVGATAAAYNYAVGSTAYYLPTDCVATTVVINGVTYEQCGSTYFQPYFSGTTTAYIVVDPPR